jgi:hypothetical protein
MHTFSRTANIGRKFQTWSLHDHHDYTPVLMYSGILKCIRNVGVVWTLNSRKELDEGRNIPDAPAALTAFMKTSGPRFRIGL